ncbi:amidohydrolase [Streptococcus bovimastitidis]|uniref:Amidohydrolase n=1 Tax=Streptococcus bovimastitidis TaxID=1856638 RepID=A0A1L8MNW0_9STRE|nr:amidohydrolase [Streptococcus bovimastitidis]OJF72464.1 amidohydrolase [Streptococcus bovimastitidis]
MAIEKLFQELEKIGDWQENAYKYLHSNPELSMQERGTVTFLRKALESLGYACQEIGGGLVTVLENGPGKTVLFRADIDALPVKEETGLDYASSKMMQDLEGNLVPVMHACGHDMHMAAVLGLAHLMINHQELWQGTLILLFQPGEETASGAQAMLEDGLMSKIPKPDLALAQHVLAQPQAGKVGIMAGPFLSSAASLKVIIKGKGAHGSMPHLSIDPIVIASSIVLKLQTIVAREVDPFQFAVVTVGSIQSGIKANIIPDQATLLLNIRAYDDAVLNQLITSIERIAKAENQAGNGHEEPEITVYDRFPVTDNNQQLAKEVKEAFIKHLGQDNVVDYQAMTASEDFSYIPRAFDIPYLYWGFGAFTSEQKIYANHNPHFAPSLQPTLKTGSQAALIATLHFLGNQKE